MSLQLSEEELAEFNIEATELLDAAETGLLNIDKGGEHSANYDAIFRVFHSLKGASGMLGLTLLNSHMHEMENILSSCKADAGLLRGKVGFFLSGVDAARRILQGEKLEFDYLAGMDAQVHQQASTPPSVEDNPPAASTLPIVYVVDDEPALVESLTECLKGSGLHAIGFVDPAQMLTQYKVCPPDLVVTDVRMPDLDGLAVLAETRRFDPDIPVIFVSGFLSREVLLAAIEKGVHSVIEKPFNGNTVISHCLSALRQRQTLKLLARSISLILFQFPDLDELLARQGKEDLRMALRSELEELLKVRRAFKGTSQDLSDLRGTI